MSQKGNHTFDLYLCYHLCPKCSYIFESRKDFSYAMGKYVKDLECPRCKHTYQLEKDVTTSPIGPIFGNAPKPEFDWR